MIVDDEDSELADTADTSGYQLGRERPASTGCLPHSVGVASTPGRPAVPSGAGLASRKVSTAATRRFTSPSAARFSFWNSELMCFSIARSLR